jgi:hypothetical protein
MVGLRPRRAAAAGRYPRGQHVESEAHGRPAHELVVERAVRAPAQLDVGEPRMLSIEEVLRPDVSCPPAGLRRRTGIAPRPRRLPHASARRVPPAARW